MLALAPCSIVNANAQTAAATPAPGNAVVLSVFEVASTRDAGYRATNSVSGSRINLKLIDMPQTISVLTSDFIKDIGATEIDDAAIYASGVSTNGFFIGRYSIRGFDTGTARRNGLSFAGGNAPIDAAVVDRIEVVKGPSSALYGTGGPGGVVNLITKTPQARRGTSLESSIDTEGSLRGELDTTGPVTRNGVVLYRLVATAQRQNSTRQFGERESLFLAPSLRWNLRGAPHPTFITVTTEWSRVPEMISADERFPQVIESRRAPLGTDLNRMVDIATGYVPGLPRDFNIAGPNARRRDDEVYFEANVVHTFSDQLSARLVYAESRQHQVRFTAFANGALKRDAAGNLPRTIPIQSWRSDTDDWNRSLRADLNFAQKFSWTKLNMVLGGQDSQSAGNSSVYRNLRRPVFNLFAPTAADYQLGAFPADYNHLVHERNAGHGRHVNFVGNAVFLDDRLNFVGAANRSYSLSGVLVRSDLRASGGHAPGTTPAPERHFDSFQGGVTYRVLPALNVFYSYSESIQSNGAQFPNDPQEGTGHEIGMRFELLSGRLSGSVSFFDVERTNIPRRDPNLPGSTAIRLSGKERSRGYEVDVFWFPTDALQLVANYTDMNPEVVSNTAAPVTEGSLINSAFPWALNAFAKYTFKTGTARGLYMTAGANARSRSRPYGTLENLYLLEHSGYTAFSGSLGYRWKRGETEWHAELSLKNATDKFYFTDTSIPAEARVGVFKVGVKF